MCLPRERLVHCIPNKHCQTWPACLPPSTHSQLIAAPTADTGELLGAASVFVEKQWWPPYREYNQDECGVVTSMTAYQLIINPILIL